MGDEVGLRPSIRTKIIHMEFRSALCNIIARISAFASSLMRFVAI